MLKSMATFLASAVLTGGVLLSANPAFAYGDCGAQVKAFKAAVPAKVGADIDALKLANTDANFAKLEKDFNAMTDQQLKKAKRSLDKQDDLDLGEGWDEATQEGVDPDQLMTVAHLLFDDGGVCHKAA
jgi:hypothetical protein